MWIYIFVCTITVNQAVVNHVGVQVCLLVVARSPLGPHLIPPSGSCHQSITSNKLPFNCQSRNLHIAYIYVWFGFQNQDPPSFNQSRPYDKLPFKLPTKISTLIVLIIWLPNLFQYMFELVYQYSLTLNSLRKFSFCSTWFFQPRVARGSRCCGSITCNKLAFNCQSSHKPHLTREGITGSYYSEKQRKKTWIKLFEIGATRE